MREDASVADAETSAPVGTDALARRIDQVMREIEQVKRERAAEAARLARAQLAAVHTAKRRRKSAAERPQRSG